MSTPRTSLFSRLFRRTTKTIRNPKPNGTRLGVHQLEDRHMLAAVLSASLDLAENILRVEGTDGADDIQIYQPGNGAISINDVQIAVTDLDGNTTMEGSVPEDQVARIEVTALGGDDSIYIGNGGIPAPIPLAIDAGDGNDTIYVQTGGATIDAGAGNDTVYAGDGNTTIYAGDGDDVIYGNVGDDYIECGAGNDVVYAGLGNDTVDGQDGNDIIWGGSASATDDGDGNDYLDGGDGDDGIAGEGGADTIIGGAGNDDLTGCGGDRSIPDAGNYIDGGDGDDRIEGGSGDDTLYGGEGDDYFIAGGGVNRLEGGGGTNTYADTAGLDVIVDPVLTNGLAMTQVVRDKWADLGGADGFLGQPTADDAAAAGGDREATFEGGSVYTTPSGDTWAVSSAIQAKYDGLGGADSYLGQPTADETDAPGGGRIAAFTGGSIFYTNADDAQLVSSASAATAAIKAKYLSLGGAGGFLGKPTGAETDALNGGRMQAYQGGRIYFSLASGGAWSIHGAILDKYNATVSMTDAYGKSVQGILGLPTSDEITLSTGVWVNHFQHGDIYARSGVGVYAVYGAIWDEYNATASLKDAYGTNVQTILKLPSSDEVWTANGGRVVHFQGGDIYANLGVRAFTLYGAIKNEYNATASMKDAYGKKVQDILGLPTSEDVPTSTSGRVVHFQHGDIYANLGVGAFTLYGAIKDDYNATASMMDVSGKWVQDILGLPTSEELSVAGGGRVVHFKSGDIYANLGVGAFALYGHIKDKWASLGGAQGLLGLPTSDVFTTADGSQVSNFQGGTISWRADVGYHLGFNRNQVIWGIKKSEADGKMDAGEFSYFKSIATDPQIFVDAATRNLLYKMIVGDPANATSRVGADPTFGYYSVGNIPATGASAWQVDTLEKKWFEGLDRPYTGATDGSTVYAYAKVEGNLFGPNGPDVQDMDQGADGDCYFIAALGAVALKHPDIIRNMFTDNGDGTFTVRFFNNGQPQYVTVDRYVPVAPNGALVYAGNSRFATLNDPAHPESQPIWAILAEKAFAQLDQSGWVVDGDKTNSYNGILGSKDGGLNGGFSSGSLGYITGLSANSDFQPDDRLELKTSVQRDFRLGRAIVVSTLSDGVNVPELAPDHEYVVEGCDASGITVINPWGHDNLNGNAFTYLSWGQFMSNFDLEDSIA